MSDIWKHDPDPVMAALEQALWELGRDYLYRVHLDTHRTMGFPPLPKAAVERVYRMPIPHKTLAKAHQSEARERAWSRALRRFRELRQTGRFGPEDARALAEAVTEKWYAEGLLDTRARTRAVRTWLAGHIRAHPAAPRPSPAPATWEEAGRVYRLREPELNTLRWAEAHLAEQVTHLKEKTRHAVAETLLGALERREHPEAAARQLLGQFATLNRDWRMIALTEVHATHAAGFLSAHVGDEVEWVAAPDACPYCRQYHGKRFLVVSPDYPNKDFHKHLWPAKTNVGRSFHPTTRDGRRRTKDELAGPALPVHPHCRCRVIPVRKVGADPRVVAYIQAVLGR